MLQIIIFATPREISIVYVGYHMEVYMKKVTCILVSLFVLLLSVTACGKKDTKDDITLIKHFGQEKYDEMKTECDSQEQIDVANGLILQAKEIMQFIGTENDIDNMVDVGALKKYYYFNSEVKKAVVDIKLITTNQNGDKGYIWVEYSTDYYDLNETIVHGVAKIKSRWDIEKKDDVWKVVNIDEIN